MPGPINTGTHPKLLWPGVKDIWGQMHAEHAPEYTDLYEVETSSQAYEEYLQVTGFGLAPLKAEGASVAYDSELQGGVARFTNLAYALGYIVTYEELQDNKYPVVASRRAKANAFSMNQTVELTAAGPYNRAFTSGYTYTDGKVLCATDHPLVHGGTLSNALTPAADLSEASLEDLTIQIMGFVNDRNQPINIMPESLHIARQEWYNANRILKSVLQPGGNNNDINVLKSTNAFPKGIKLNHYFTAAHAWFIRTNAPEGPKFFWRERPSLKQDNDFDTMNAKAYSYMRLSCGFVDTARSIAGSNGP